MVLDFKIKGRRRAPATDFDVTVFIGTDRYGSVRQVRQTQQNRIQLGLNRIQLNLATGQIAAHGFNTGHQRCDIFAASLGLANAFGDGITLGLELLGQGLDFFTLGFQRVDARYVQLVATGCQAIRYVLQVGT